MAYNVRGAKPGDIFAVAKGLRKPEVEEMFAGYGMKPIQGVADCYHSSSVAYTAVKNGETLCMFGVRPVMIANAVASPWLLTTDAISKYPRALLHGTQWALEQWTDQFAFLFNYVDARYEQSLRWAKWAGFEVHEAQPFGYLGLPFHKITIGDEEWARPLQLQA